MLDASFPCERCGSCCRKISAIPQLSHWDDGTGVCAQLGANGLCRIYSERPDVCRFEYVYETYFKDTDVGEFIKMSKGICVKLRETP